MKRNSKYKPLDIDEIMRMSDSDFLAAVYSRNHFTLKGRKRRFKYRTTNENVTRFLNHMNVKQNDIILSVSSSGVKLFEMLSREKQTPKAIIAFDYSPKQVAYNYLLKAAIRVLPYGEFARYFGLKDNGIERAAVRTRLMLNIPPQMKNYLPRRHHFTKRDALLNEHNRISWFKNERKYNILKNRLDRIKFCEYEISHHNLALASIFKPRTFNVVYLSNVFDWLCWHNRDVKNTLPLEAICDDIYKIMKKNGKVVLCSLKTRKSLSPNFFNNLRVEQDITYRTYKYLWRSVTAACQ
ncbi:MAG: DUF3419 family protein [Candidatus Colwellbacteria bacterium]|nr:DUF3419 family protein [Candidatus Colwellbacteria bacterium]